MSDQVATAKRKASSGPKTVGLFCFSWIEGLEAQPEQALTSGSYLGFTHLSECSYMFERPLHPLSERKLLLHGRHGTSRCAERLSEPGRANCRWIAASKDLKRSDAEKWVVQKKGSL